MMQVWDENTNPMGGRPKDKNKTKVETTESQNLMGQIMNQYVEFYADALDTGKTMFKTYSDP